MIGETEVNGPTMPCPGAPMDFAFKNLIPGQSYTITLREGLNFTRAVSETNGLPGGVTFDGVHATFKTPTQDADSVDVSFVVGVVVTNVEVSLSTNLTGAETVKVSLLSGGASGQDGPITFTAIDDLPPTCVVLNPRVPSCPVCAMDISKCPEASVVRGSQFCMGQHIFLCCLECPGSGILPPD